MRVSDVEALLLKMTMIRRLMIPVGNRTELLLQAHAGMDTEMRMDNA